MKDWLSESAIRIAPQRDSNAARPERTPMQATANKLRDLAERGMTCSQAAREIGVSVQFAHRVKKRFHIAFRDGRRK